MKKLLPLIIALTAFSVSSVFAQTAASSPAASASPSPSKHKHSKKTATAATATGSPAASASPAKHSWFKPKSADATEAATPAAPSTSGGASTKPAVPSGTVAPGGGAGQVWVNTESHVYHKEGTKYYGKTKHGKYMSEADAMKEGDHADKAEEKAAK